MSANEGNEWGAVEWTCHTALKISRALDSFIASVEFCRRACIN
jgi:hypothetical protein